jgi:exosortase
MPTGAKFRRQLMSQTAETPTIKVSHALPRVGWFSLQFVILFVLLAVLYTHILAALIGDWAADPNYSHGFIVVPCCAWIVWRERKRIADQEVKPSWLGFVVMVGALGMLVLGVLGAELFLSRTSFIILLAGLIIQFRGWRFFRSVLLPWGILFLAVPLPAIIFNQVALPLQFEASRLASQMLGLLGIPVLRQGNIIVLPSLTLDVVEACSGLRSLVSLITLAVLYGYFFERRNFRRILLVVAAVPIAVFANGFRIMGTGLLGQYWSPEKAEGFFHEFTGVLIFFVSIALLVGFHALLSWVGRWSLTRRLKWS